MVPVKRGSECGGVAGGLRMRRRFGSSKAIGPFRTMIAIAITPAAYDAIKATLLPRIDAAPSPGADGLIRIWLDRNLSTSSVICGGPAKATAT
jgi:hypothetical protein